MNLSSHKALKKRFSQQGYDQMWSRGHKKIRGQGQGQGQPFRGQTLSKPRTQAQVFSKKSLQKKFLGDLKKSLQKNFLGVRQNKKSVKDFFQAIYKTSTVQKIVLSSSRDRAIFEDLRPRGQGHQNVSSRLKTSSRAPQFVGYLVTDHSIDRALQIEQYSIWHGARIVCLGKGAQKLGLGDAYAAETRRIRNAAAIWWIFCSKSCVILL